MKKILCICLVFMLVLSGCGNKYKTTYETALKYLSEGDYQQAVLSFTEAIDIDPKQAAPYMNRGVAYVRSGNYEAAMDDFKKASELDPSVTADTIIEAVVKSIEDCWQDGGLSEDGTGEPILMDKLYDLLKEKGLIGDEKVEDLISRYIDSRVESGKFTLRTADLETVKSRVSFTEFDSNPYDVSWTGWESEARAMDCFALHDETGDYLVSMETEGGEVLCHYQIMYWYGVNAKNHPKEAQEEYQKNLTIVLEFDYMDDGTVLINFRRMYSYEMIDISVKNNIVEDIYSNIMYYGSFMYGRYLECLTMIDKAMKEKGMSLNDLVDVNKLTSIIWVNCH